MATQGNQPKQPEQPNKPQQQPDTSRSTGQDKGRPQSETGTNRGTPDEQRKGTPGAPLPSRQDDRTRKDAPTGNNPDVTIPNPKNPGYGDNEPGDPRRLEIDAEKQSPESGKQNPRRT